MNIREGDLFVVSGSEYPVRSVAEYDSTHLVSTRAFMHLAKVSASTKRSPAVASGKRGVPVTLLTDLSCTPLDPVDAETRQRLMLDTPHELKQTFLTDGTGFVHLILEDLKR